MENVVIKIIDTHNDFQVIEKYTQLGGPVLNYSGDESRFGSIMSSKFTFNMLNETAEDGRYLDLLSGEERRFLIQIRDVSPYTVRDGILLWQGFLLPDVYSEPYENVSFFVNFTATDGIDALRTKPFLFFKTRSVVDYIARCLFETGLQQDIYFAPGIVNSFFDWKNIQLFEECFSKYNESTESYDYSNCYEVLESLLKAVAATLFTYEGKWYIVGYKQKVDQLLNFVVYDHFGVFKKNETYLRDLKEPKFNTGVNVSTESPFKTVQLNVDYERTELELLPESLYKTEDYESKDLTWPDLKSLPPFNNWVNKAGSDIMFDSDDATEYLSVDGEAIDGSHFWHSDDEVPYQFKKSPFYLNVYKHFSRPVDFEKDYVELRPEKRVFVSPQMDSRPLEFDIDFDLRINYKANEQKFKEDFYKQAFRIDLLVGNNIVFSTRTESNIYNSANNKMTFSASQDGPNYLWYTPISFPNWKYSLYRFRTPSSLKAEITKKGLRINTDGELNVRIYLPRNADNNFVIQDDFHVSMVTVVKLGLTIKSWNNERFQVQREIRYTTKYETDLSFSDGKNDLYSNLFKLNERNDYRPFFNETVLHDGPVISDNLYYRVYVPGTIYQTIIDRFYTMKIYSGTKWVYAHLIFGKIDPQSGIDLKFDQLFISKARIDEFPEWRSLLHNITKITYASAIYLTWPSERETQQKYISWKRPGSSVNERYLNCLGKLVHECQPSLTPKIEATTLQIITPLDLVKFKWMGWKVFYPSSLTIDFSNGKTGLMLHEAITQNLEDYAT